MKDYIITKDGKIISLKNNKKYEIKGYIDRYGYRRVFLYIDGKRVKYFVHRLVAQTYLDNPNNLPQVNHIDGNKLNNCVDNLEWCTPKENIQHAIRIGLRTKKGKLTEKQVKEIKNSFNQKSMREIAKMYGVSLECIKHIHAGHTWRNI